MTHLVVGLYIHSTHLLTTTFVPGSDFEIREGEVPAPVEIVLEPGGREASRYRRKLASRFPVCPQTLKKIKQEPREKAEGEAGELQRGGPGRPLPSLRELRRAAVQRAVGRALQTEGTARAKAPRAEQAWLMPGTERPRGLEAARAKEL